MRLHRISMIFLALTYNVAHAAPGVITYAVIGAADPNKKVPVLNGVTGAGVSNLDVALPVYLLKPGVTYEVVIGAQSYSYAGTCTASYTLGTGTTGTGMFSNYTSSTFNCPATSVWTFPFPVEAVPNKAGPALLTATVKFGTTAVVTKIPLMIQ